MVVLLADDWRLQKIIDEFDRKYERKLKANVGKSHVMVFVREESRSNHTELGQRTEQCVRSGW